MVFISVCLADVEKRLFIFNLMFQHGKLSVLTLLLDTFLFAPIPFLFVHGKY